MEDLPLSCDVTSTPGCLGHGEFEEHSNMFAVPGQLTVSPPISFVNAAAVEHSLQTEKCKSGSGTGPSLQGLQE